MLSKLISCISAKYGKLNLEMLVLVLLISYLLILPLKLLNKII
jgi:competence protein ComGC